MPCGRLGTAGPSGQPPLVRAVLNLGIFYFIFFSLIGIFLPYFNLYCRSIGFSPAQIGFFMAAFASVKCVSPILWGRAADRTGRRRELLVLSGWGSLLTFLGFFFTRRFEIMLFLILLFGFFRSPIMPMIEATTWEQIPVRGWQYGKIRLWGSIGFITATLLAGILAQHHSIRSILHAMLALLIVQAAFMVRIPASSVRHHDPHGTVRALLAKIDLDAFFLIGFLTQVSHGMYYSLFSIHLTDLGFNESVVGLCWTVSIVCEVILMHNYEAWFGRFQPMKVIMISGATAALRWFMLSRYTNLLIIFIALSLHAMTFAACHIASLKYLQGNVPKGMRTTGQSLYSSFAFGIGILVGSSLAGMIYQEAGGSAMFKAASLIALATTALAGLHIALFPEKRA